MDVRALVFDVFGTLVDWRSGVAREARRVLGAGAAEAEALADDWRGRYVPSMERVRTGELPWTVLDALHRSSLDDVLSTAGLTADAGERAELVLAWHRLDPWPDVVGGLTRLRRDHVLAPLSNGNVALLVDLARHGGLPWDLVLGAEVVQRYKPDPAVYDSAPRLLALRPDQVLMVAAHVDDLAAARARGLRTAYVHRPDEFGATRTPPDTDPDADLAVTSLTELAEALGC